MANDNGKLVNEVKVGDTFESSSSLGHSVYTVTRVETTKAGRYKIFATTVYTTSEGEVRYGAERMLTNGAIIGNRPFFNS